jgi:hypothetical protein
VTTTSIQDGCSDSHKTWKCADQELERQIRCFPYVELSDKKKLEAQVSLTPLQHDFALDPIIPPFDFHFDFS